MWLPAEGPGAWTTRSFPRGDDVPVADTSWLVALHSARDRFHKTAVARAAGENDLVVPDVVLGEFLNTMFWLSGGRTKPDEAAAESRQVLNGILRTPAFRLVSDSDPEQSRRLFLDHPELSYPDAVGIRVALETSAELLTFDGPQRRRWEGLRKR